MMKLALSFLTAFSILISGLSTAYASPEVESLDKEIVFKKQIIEVMRMRIAEAKSRTTTDYFIIGIVSTATTLAQFTKSKRYTKLLTAGLLLIPGYLAGAEAYALRKQDIPELETRIGFEEERIKELELRRDRRVQKDVTLSNGK